MRASENPMRVRETTTTMVERNKKHENGYRSNGEWVILHDLGVALQQK